MPLPASTLTSLSSDTAFASVADLLDYFDWRQVADFVTEPIVTPAAGSVETRPTYATLTDSVGPSVEYTRLVRFLKLASGWVESACSKGRRYQPQDLQALYAGVTVSREVLVSLVCSLGFYALAGRKAKALRPEDVQRCEDALKMLDQLEKGERIFGFDEAAGAGLPETTDQELEDHEKISTVARRFFGKRI